MDMTDLNLSDIDSAADKVDRAKRPAQLVCCQDTSRFEYAQPHAL